MPFTPAQLAAVKTIVIHGPTCPDGIASYILARDVLPNAEVKFVQYNTDEYLKLPATPGMLFIDVAPPEERVQEFVTVGALVLDHHKTRKACVEALGANGVFGDEVTEPGVCGAVLAYRHVWRPLQMKRTEGVYPAPEIDKVIFEDVAASDFATLAGIYDTWQTQSPRWKEAVIQAEMLRFYPIEHWFTLYNPFHEVNKSVWEGRRQIAALLVEKNAKATQNVLGKAWRFFSFKRTRVIVFEGTKFSNDAAEMLGNTVDIVIGFGFLIEDGAQKMFLATRSHTGYDVSAFAKAYGGGGHTAAAGCNVRIEHAPNPYDLVEKMVNDFERD
jgi:hypothetical protein